jgi:formate hydrogenlyase subunit 4
LVLGVINRTKAIFAGRRGQPLFQAYYDIAKCLGKGATYSKTTTWAFRVGPAASLAALVVATAIMPLGGATAPVAFAGDIILFAYLLGLVRFLTVVAALDTGSAFEGMGASREVTFGALAEPVLFVGLAAVARVTESLSLSGMLAAVRPEAWATAGAAFTLVTAALLAVILTENARIPVDDPNTHLELTMIHEVMVLDHSGPDFAFIQYGAALKMWVLGALLVGIAVPVRTGNAVYDISAALGGIFVLAVVIGVIESTMARLRLLRVPQLLVSAGALSILAVILALKVTR